MKTHRMWWWAFACSATVAWGCAGETGQGGDAAPGGPDAVVEDGPGGPDGQLTGTASLRAQVKLIKDFPLQVVDLLKQYLTTPDYIFRGDLYLQLCQTADCATPVVTRQVLTEELFSTGFPKDVTVDALPAGSWYARFVLDTKYSAQYQGAMSETGSVGPMDVLQVAAGAELPTPGKNPPPGTVEVTLTDGATSEMGEALLGSIVFENPGFPPATAPGFLLVAASGTDGFRNAIKVVDESSFQVLDAIVPTMDGKEFEGDICGFVRGQGTTLWVVAVGAAGAYVFPFDTGTRTFGSAQPVLIPHPDYQEGGSTDGLEPEMYPWPCRGVSIVKNGKEYLYLVAFKGAGALTNSAPYPLVIVEVTGMATGGTGRLVAAMNEASDPFFETSRILRGAATDGESLFLLEASWSKLVDNNTVYAFSIGPDGMVTKTAEVASGTAEDTCGATNNWVPTITVVEMGGQKVIAVGNDEDISFYNLSLGFLGKVDTKDYGMLITSFAVSPDGKRLYAMPNCKSASAKASVQLGTGTDRTDLDRHAAVILDLTVDPTSPKVVETERDFDEDGDADGGIDLEFLYLKRSLLRWCEACTGVVPPTSYTGPEIAIGAKNLFLRGTGIQGEEKNSSGLGQLADIGVFDLASGKGVMFRDYQVWLDGPSSRWGFDLNPANPIKDYQDDVSTAALLWVAQ